MKSIKALRIQAKFQALFEKLAIVSSTFPLMWQVIHLPIFPSTQSTLIGCLHEILILILDRQALFQEDINIIGYSNSKFSIAFTIIKKLWIYLHTGC